MRSAYLPRIYRLSSSLLSTILWIGWPSLTQAQDCGGGAPGIQTHQYAGADFTNDAIDRTEATPAGVVLAPLNLLQDTTFEFGTMADASWDILAGAEFIAQSRHEAFGGDTSLRYQNNVGEAPAYIRIGYPMVGPLGAAKVERTVARSLAHIFIATGSVGRLRLTASVYYADGSRSRNYAYADFATQGTWQSVGSSFHTDWGKQVVGLSLGITALEFVGSLYIDDVFGSLHHHATGTVDTQIIDLGGDCLSLFDVRPNVSLPPGARIDTLLRGGNDARLADAGDWIPIDDHTDLQGFPRVRFIQYRFILGTQSLIYTPTVRSIETVFGEGAVTIDGQVVHSETNAPIEQAQVKVGPYTLRTGRYGRFRVSLTPGEYTVRIEKALFDSAAQPLVVRADDDENLVLPLAPNGTWPMLRGEKSRVGASPVILNMARAPELLWEYSLPGGQALPQIMPFDVDQDGTQELVTVEAERVVARRPDGTLVWRSSVGAGAEIGSIIGITDLDGDGVIDIVGGTRVSPGANGHYRVGRLTVLRGDTGALQFVHSFVDAHEGFGTVVDISPEDAKIVDMNGDGFKEVVVSPVYAHAVTVLDFSAGIAQGRVLWTGEWQGYANHNQPAIADVTGDGTKDVVIRTTRRLVVLDGEDGTPSYSDDIYDSVVYGNLFLRNIDADAQSEIVFVGHAPQALLAFDVTAGSDGEHQITTRYRVDLPTIPVVNEGSVIDIDADGVLEVILNYSDGGLRLAVYDAQTGALEVDMDDIELRGVAHLNDDVMVILGVKANEGLVGIVGDADEYQVAFTLPDMGFNRWRHPRRNESSTFGYWSTSHVDQVLQDPATVYMTRFLPEMTADIDNDGHKEVITRSSVADHNTIFAIDPNLIGDEGLKWQVDFPPDVQLMIPVHGIRDLDGDGFLEVIVHRSDGVVTVVDHLGRIEHEFSTHTVFVNPRVVDLDQDGSNEILFLQRDHHSFRRFDGKLKVIEVRSDNGSPTVEAVAFPHTATVSGQYGRDPVVIDMDGDQQQELILVAETRQSLEVIRAGGEVVWEANFVGSDRILRMGIARLNTDDVTDVYVILEGGEMYAYDGVDGALIWHREIGGYTYIPTVYDVDSDGFDDMTFVGGNDQLVSVSGKDGELLWEYHFESLCTEGTMIAMDVDGNGTVEFSTTGNYASLRVGSTGELIWTGAQSEGSKDTYGVVVDINGDGIKDVIEPFAHGVFGFDGQDGHILWSIETPNNLAATSVTLVDIDGDGTQEFIVGIDSVLSARAVEDGQPIWEVDLEEKIGYVTVADSDGDGVGDILVSTAGRLRAFSSAGDWTDAEAPVTSCSTFLR